MSHLLIAFYRHNTATPSLHARLSALVQLLGELAPLAEPLALPVEDVDGHNDHDRQTGQDRARIFELVLVADVFVDCLRGKMLALCGGKGRISPSGVAPDVLEREGGPKGAADRKTHMV
jgi:hypothetical protein